MKILEFLGYVLLGIAQLIVWSIFFVVAGAIFVLLLPTLIVGAIVIKVLDI